MTNFSIVCAYKDLGDPHRRASFEFTRRYWSHHFPEAELMVASPEPFTRAHGLNVAVENAHYDMIVQAEPDSVVPADQIEQAIELAVERDGLVIAFSQYLYLNEEATQRLHANFPDETVLRLDEDCEFSGYGGSGPCTVYSRRTWELAHGYDERFDIWGGDDAAFAWACEALAGPGRRVEGPAIHSWHPRLPQSIPGHPGYIEQMLIVGEYRDAAAIGPDAVRRVVENR